MKSVKEIEAAFAEYLVACYSDSSLSRPQAKEVRQAFLSGIHWRDTEALSPGECEGAIRSMLDLGGEKELSL